MSETKVEKITIRFDKGFAPDLLGADRIAFGGFEVCENCLPHSDGSYRAITKIRLFNQRPELAWPVSASYLGKHFYDGFMRNCWLDGAYYSASGASGCVLFHSQASYDVTGSFPYVRRATAISSATNLWDKGFSGQWLNIGTIKYGDWNIIYGPTLAGPIGISGTDSSLESFMLGGTPPTKAACGTFFGGHVILANFKAANESGKLIRWSAFEDAENWTPSLITGCGELLLADLEYNISALEVLGDRLLVFTRNSISFGTYVGSVWTFDFVQNAVKGVGCAYSNSVISTEDSVFFWSFEGIYQMRKDGAILNVLEGTGLSFDSILRVDGEVAAENSQEKQANIGVSVGKEPTKNLVAWFVPNGHASFGTAGMIIIYNYRTKKIATVSLPVGYGSIQEIFTLGVSNIAPGYKHERIAIKALASGASGIETRFYGLDSPEYYFQASDGEVPLDSGYSTASAIPMRLKVSTLGKNDEHITLMNASLEQVSSSSTASGDQTLTVYSQSAYAASPTTASAGLNMSTRAFDVQQTGKFLALEFVITNCSAVGPLMTFEIAKTGGSR